ncbi:amino acid adenylation domain-containing protein [Patulibacter sp. NPDC049589]|uniref:amino acid adenylation domain-containing protein n=1 Tax=Patulibacter sp. NPDC049589 TaxID=3154731 RepID=UPI0034346588
MADDHSTALPLTAAQEGIWFAQQLDPGSSAFVTAECLELHGPLDLDLLATAIRTAVDEAEGLHVRVETAGELPVQRPHAPGAWPLPVVDLRGEPDPDGAAEAWTREAWRRPLDLERDRLFDEALLRVADDHVVWFQRVHHLAADAMGLSLIARRAAEIHTALAAGEDPVAPWFPALAATLEVERAYRDSPAAGRDDDHWRACFATPPRITTLTDRPESAGHDVHRASEPLDPALMALLRDAAEAVDATWPELAMAGVAAYVWRMAGTAGREDEEVPEEVVLGIPMLARLGPVALRSPATMVNVLPLRVALHGDRRPADVVRTVTDGMRGVRRHQRHRGEALRRTIGALGGGRALHGPMVNVLPFDYALTFAGVPAVVGTLGAGPVDDLSFNLYDRGDRPPRLDVEANVGRYDAVDAALHAERLPVFLRRFAAAVAAGPEDAGARRATAVAAESEDAGPHEGRPVPTAPGPTIDDLELTTPAERELVVEAWNAKQHPVDPELTLVDLLERCLLRHPASEAVRLGDDAVTFSTLHARADELAAALRGLGAGPGQIVAVAVPRSVDLLVSLVAVLKSGAAYLPLDPDQPGPRLRGMLDDARPVAAIVHDELADLVPWPETLPRSSPSGRRSGGVGPTGGPAAPPVPAAPGDPAYVLYTSGSTGKPKGVVVPHAAIVNRLLWQDAAFPIGPGDRVLQKTPVGFDVSVWELFWPLIAGVPLEVAPPGAHRDPRALAELIARSGVTVCHFVPSMLALFVDEPAAAACTGLRRVVCSGEALPGDLRDRFRDLLPGVGLDNLYGPTEAAVDVTHWDCRHDLPGAGVPIGRPVWNTRCYVLDARRRPVPIGAAGELHLAGVQLADGYLGRPDLTDAAFVPDVVVGAGPGHADDGAVGRVEPHVVGETGPAGAAPVPRMYRTGDLARWRPDGALEYLGRRDHQVKIRGQRIETGEIEAHLTDAPGVQQAAVVARVGGVAGAAGTRLVAYVVPAAACDAPALRRRLAEALSDAMVPAAFVGLDALPLTVSGKLDRAALPAPDEPAPTTGDDRAPASPTEELVARVFAELLGRERVGPDEDFFLLGGHSLLAARAVARLRAALGRDVSIGALFAAPTAAALALRLEDEDDAGALDVELPLRSGGDRPPLFCLHPAGGIGWCYAGLTRLLPAEQPVVALQAAGLDGTGELPATLDAMAADYARRIRARQPEGPYRLLGWSVGGVVAQAVAALLQEEGAEVDLLALLDAYPSDQWRDLAAPTEPDALVALLNIAGHDPARLGDAPLTRERVVDALREDGSALASLPEEVLAAMVGIVVNNATLMRTHEHRPFDGRAVFFAAAAPRPEDWLDVDAWRPHVRGGLELHELDCTHAELLKGEHVERIAAVIGPLLAGTPAVAR